MGRYQSLSLAMSRMTLSAPIRSSVEKIIDMVAVGNKDLSWMDARVADELFSVLDDVERESGLLSAIAEQDMQVVFQNDSNGDFYGDSNRVQGVFNVRINQNALLKDGLSASDIKGVSLHEINHVMQLYNTFVMADSKMNYDKAINKGYSPLVKSLVSNGILPNASKKTIDNYIGYEWKTIVRDSERDGIPYKGWQLPRERDSWLREAVMTKNPAAYDIVIGNMKDTVGFFRGNYQKELDRRKKEQASKNK